MKKQIFTATLALGAILLGFNKVQAQTTSNPATTAISMTLADVISIDAGSAAMEGTVDFNYATAEDYNTTQSVPVLTSLIVTSSKNFNVNVKADGANFESEGNLIPVNVITIKPGTDVTTTMEGTTNNIVLSTEDQALITDADLGSSLVLDLDYEISAENAKTILLGKAAGTYTQTVTYTATAE